MRTEGTMVNGESTAYHSVNLVLDLNLKLLKILALLSNSSLFLSVFVLQHLLMHSVYRSILQVISIFHA